MQVERDRNRLLLSAGTGAIRFKLRKGPLRRRLYPPARPIRTLRADRARHRILAVHSGAAHLAGRCGHAAMPAALHLPARAQHPGGLRAPGGALDPAGHAVLLYDGRNPDFAEGGQGHEAWQAVQSALKNPVLLRRCTWQELAACLRQDAELDWLTGALRDKYGLQVGLLPHLSGTTPAPELGFHASSPLALQIAWQAGGASRLLFRHR